MLDRIKDRNVLLVYQAVFVLGVAYGVSISLTPLQLAELHFSKERIGSLAAWFAGGIVLFSLPMGGIVRRFSARRTALVAIVGYAACVSIFPFLKAYLGVSFARFFDGAFSVGIWVATETILLARTSKEDKAYATSLYAMAMASGYVVGPIVAKGIVAFAPMRIGFLVSGGLALATFVLVYLRLEPDRGGAALHEDEAPTDGERSKTSSILWRIKTSCFATFSYGYFQASVVLFLPLFLMESKGVPRDRTILAPALFAVGMLLCSNYVGRIGDRFGHLLVMRVLGAIGLSMIIGFVFITSFVPMCIAIFIAGATLASISPVSLALLGVVTDAPDYSRANALYNAFYASGMLIGPPISSLFFGRISGAAMLFHLAAMWIAFVLFCTIFSSDDPAGRRAGGESSEASRGRRAPAAGPER